MTEESMTLGSINILLPTAKTPHCAPNIILKMSTIKPVRVE